MVAVDLIGVLSDGLIATVPDVTSAAPQGLGDVASTVLSWTKWIAIICGVGGIFVIAIMMMLGRRNRSQMAADGMSALPWIVGGFLLIGASTSVAQWIMDSGETFDEATASVAE